MNDLTQLFATITATRPEGAWPSLAKCQVLASLVVALRPTRVVEIGVFTGDSLVPMLLALKHIGDDNIERKAVAIDPWSAGASIQGQGEADVEWWGKLDHEAVYQKFMTRLERLEVSTQCQVIRQKSDDVDPRSLDAYQLLHVDGNHGEQATRDIERFAAPMARGSFLVIDDLDWAGGGVRKGYESALAMGFALIAPLGTGCYLQRVR